MISIPPEIWGLLSVCLAAFSLGPYFVATLRGTNKPHMLTWVIWTVLTGAAFLIQYKEGAGSGAWSGGVSTVLCAAIMIVSFKYGEKHITRFDWVMFFLAAMVFPIWLLTDNPAMAAVWVTVIDGFGYLPTMRKSWNKPYEEMVSTHGIATIKHIFVLLAVENVLFATVFYSWGMVTMNGLLVLLILVRRIRLRNKS